MATFRQPPEARQLRGGSIAEFFFPKPFFDVFLGEEKERSYFKERNIYSITSRSFFLFFDDYNHDL